MTTDFLAEAVLEKLNAIMADLAAYEKGIDNYDELQFAWEQASKSVLLNREKALAEAVASLNADIKQQHEQVKSKALANNRKSYHSNKAYNFLYGHPFRRKVCYNTCNDLHLYAVIPVSVWLHL